jgi:hypothetical protein
MGVGIAGRKGDRAFKLPPRFGQPAELVQQHADVVPCGRVVRILGNDLREQFRGGGKIAGRGEFAATAKNIVDGAVGRQINPASGDDGLAYIFFGIRPPR